MKYLGALVLCIVLTTGVFCVEPYPRPAPVGQTQVEEERPQWPSLFDIFSSYPSSSVVEVPFRGFGQRWRGLESMMRYLDSQMNDMMREIESLIPIDREREEWYVSHPVVTETNGTRVMKLTLDMRQFKPEEISVKVKDGVLYINAKQESKSDFSTVFRQYLRQFSLPEGVVVEDLRSTLSPEGVLIVTAPLEDEEGIEEEGDGQHEAEEEEAEEEEEEEEEQETRTTTQIPLLPELPPEHLPEPEREKKEETINIIHE